MPRTEHDSKEVSQQMPTIGKFLERMEGSSFMEVR